MIKSVKLKNFRNFIDKEFYFSNQKNYIIWNNWSWKSNILEAINMIYKKDISKKNINNLINENEKYSFIEIQNCDWKNFSISLDKEKNIKKLLINWKSTTRSKFNEHLYKTIYFQPMDMNIMYLSPSLRRDFLDNIISNNFPNFSKINKEYKNIVRNRNKILKNIKEDKSKKDEIIFWDKILVDKAKLIYDYREKLNTYFKENISILKSNINFKVDDIKYNYITKVDLNDIENSINSYLKKNFERDIILGNTHIWPHVDDFDIKLNWFSLVDFASRWETKSIILGLKIIETKFTKDFSWKQIIFLIDDLFSELDEIHENILLNEIWANQIIITSISSKDSYKENSNIIYL